MKFLNKIWNYGFFWQVSKMVENNRVFSYDLAGYIFLNPNPSVSDFDSRAFNLIKPMIKEQLHKEQDGLCVYCERKLAKDEGQIEHIKPKNGKHAYPHLCFQYSNYAHSCINPKTCGQKKRDSSPLYKNQNIHLESETLVQNKARLKPSVPSFARSFL